MKILVVDDEQAICDGLTGIIAKNLDSGDEVISSYDSVEALELMENEKFDLLITDISMPEIDGLELTRLVKKKGCIKYVIIVTGFDQFDYAREALRQRTIDYLLKPINKNELISNIRLVSEKLRSKRLLVLLSEMQLLARGLDGFPISVKGTEKSDLGDDFILVAFDCSAAERIEDLWKSLVRIEHKYTHNFIRNRGENCLIAAFPDQAGLGGIILKELANIDSAIGISETSNGLNMINESVDRTLCALMASRISNKKPVEWNERDASGRGMENLLSVKLESSRQILDTFGSLLENYRIAPLLRIYSLRKLIRLLHYRADIRYNGMAGKDPDSRFFQTMTTSEMLRLAHEMAERESVITPAGSPADKVMELITEIPFSDLFLENLGEKLSLSPGYISRLVRESTGESFLEYATKLRMEEAKKLLAISELTIMRIAEKVGFTSPRQFYRQFKKFSGFTPSQYRLQKKKTARNSGLHNIKFK